MIIRIIYIQMSLEIWESWVVGKQRIPSRRLLKIQHQIWPNRSGSNKLNKIFSSHTTMRIHLWVTGLEFNPSGKASFCQYFSFVREFRGRIDIHLMGYLREKLKSQVQTTDNKKIKVGQSKNNKIVTQRTYRFGSEDEIGKFCPIFEWRKTSCSSTRRFNLL